MPPRVSRLRVFLTLHLAMETLFLLPLIYTSWVLETLSDDPGLIATYLVLVVRKTGRSCSTPCVLAAEPCCVLQGGIEHTVCSCMVLVSLCTVICPCCRDAEHALKAVRRQQPPSPAQPSAYILFAVPQPHEQPAAARHSSSARLSPFACVPQYGAFCIMGCCASIVQVVATALLVNKSDGFEQLAISIREEDGGGLAAYRDGSSAGVRGTARPFVVDPSAAEHDDKGIAHLEQLVSLVWIVIVSFILVGAVLLPFRAVGAAWSLYKGCEEAVPSTSNANSGAGSGVGPEGVNRARSGSSSGGRRAVRERGSSDAPPGRRRGDSHSTSHSSGREYRALSEGSRRDP